MPSKLWNSSRPGDARRAFDCELLKRFCDDTHGGVLVYMGIMLPILLGVTGLALDASLWYAQKRTVQAIADTTAYSMALELKRVGDETLAKYAAKNDAVVYGLDESEGDIITFNSPPKYGDFAGTAGFHEVIVERPASIFLAGLLLADDFNIAARAVAALETSGNCYSNGILAKGVTEIEQGASIGNGVCVYGRGGVQMSQNITVEDGGSVGALDINSITYQQGFSGDPSTFFEGEMDLSIADNLGSLIDDLENGLYLPENIDDVMVVDSLPDSPIPGTAYILNNDLNIDQDFELQDVLLVVRGEIDIGQNGSITNSYGTCPDGEPGVGIIATGKIVLNQGSTSKGVQLISSNDLHIEQNAHFEGNAIVDGNAHIQQAPVLSACGSTVGAETGIFADAQLVE